MARRDVLLKIHTTLNARRSELRKRLGMDLRDLAAAADGDAAETALEAEGIELAGTLAALEARELAKVERALQRLKRGRYGTCDGCDGKIPVARLNFMPTVDLCIACQREAERDSSWLDGRKIERYADGEELAVA
jgi:DnaK suppressor protein